MTVADHRHTATTTAAVVHTAADHALSDAARAALDAGVPAATRRAYNSDWTAFTAWCAERHRVPLPATSQTVTEYVTHLTLSPTKRTGRPLAPSSIDRVIASIRTMHQAAAVAAPETKAARKVVAGYRERLATDHDPAARPSKATAAIPAALRAMIATADRSTLTGMRDAALLLLGYATAARVSELAALDVADVRHDGDGLIVVIYRRKIKSFTESAVPYGRNPATCPVRAFIALREAMAATGRTSGPLLVRIDQHGHVAPPLTRHGKPIGDPTGRMTAEAVGQVVTRAADAAGLEGEWSGHSLRRGFATTARRAGAHLETIGRHGGWADGSKALLGYIDDADRWENNPVAGL